MHEQTISHRIAVYLESLFRGYHVDCEYNKHGSDVKNIDKKIIFNIEKAHSKCKCKSCRKWCQGHPRDEYHIYEEVEIRPDIIVHKKRGEKSRGNILVIEMKKSEECLFDQEKLKALTYLSGNYRYLLGVFLYFPNGKPRFRWFINGKKANI